jgi:filamentous hemagglutinin family protein
MNNCYRLIWNEITRSWVAVAEIAKARGKHAAGSVLMAAAGVALAAPPNPPAPTQLPAGGKVVAGNAVIAQSGAALNINQNSNRAAIDWQSFNLGSQASVNFNQPGAGSVTLNRVLDSNPSQIFGRITAPGQVFLSNPNGVYFGPSASVDVGGLVATTHSISNDDFMAGKTTFVRNGATGSVINEGELKATLGGYVALLAPEVRNQGAIVAQLGTVALAAGEAYELQFDANNTLANILVTPATIKALVENGNAVQASGGLIILSAQAVDRLQGGVVNNSGVLEATGLVNDGGRIVLEASDRISHTGSINADAASNSVGKGGKVTLIASLGNAGSMTEIDGSISARGGNLGGNGGFIETSAEGTKIGVNTHIDASAPKGKSGTWLIDPTDFTISAGSAAQTSSGIGADTLSANLGTSDVTIQTSSSGVSYGDITVSGAVTKTTGTATTLTLAADRNVLVYAPISGSLGHPLNVVLAARAGGGADGAVDVGADIKTYGGNVTIGGGDLQASGYAIGNSSSIDGVDSVGVYVGSHASYSAMIDATGDGSSTADMTLPTAISGGNIVIRGSSSTTPFQSNLGIHIGSGITSGSIVTGGNGSITLDGAGGNSVDHFWSIASVGILLEQNAYIKANTGNISIKGTAGTGYDRYGIVSTSTNKLIGTNGYLLIDGDSLMIREATLDIYVGQNSDIKVPVIGCTAGGFGIGCAAYTLQKTGPGILNLWGDASAWHSSLPPNTYDTPTNGTFTDASNTVNIVSLGANQALYAFGTRPATISLVSTSTGAPSPVAIFLRLISGSSVYGDTPNFTYGYYTDAAADSAVTDAAPSGTVNWNGAPAAGSSVGSYSITYNSGIVLGNAAYILSAGNATNWLVISRPLTVTANNVSKTYGAADPALTYAVGGGLVAGDSLSGSLVRASGNNTGTYAITQGNLSGGGNYTLTFVDGSMAINKSPLTIAADDASKTYGQTPTLTAFTASGLQYGETIGSVSETSAGTSATASVSGGPYAITPSAATGGTFSTGNYAITYANGSLTVTPAPLTVTAGNASKTYGGQTPALTAFTASGLQYGETIGSVTEASAGASATASVSGGPYAITPSAATGGTFSADNYTIAYANGSLTVTPAPLTVTAGNASKATDGVAYSGGNGVAYTGFVNNETSAVLGGALRYTGSSQGATNAGNYAIAPQGLTSENYQLTFADGTLTIYPAPPPPLSPPPNLPQVAPQSGSSASSGSLTLPGNSSGSGSSGTSSRSQAISGGAESSSGDGSGGGISVSLVRQPSVQETGIITVSVPKEMATAGSGFNFPLPAQVADTAENSDATIHVTTVTGQALPAWLQFNPATKSFVASAVPDGAFPMQLVVTVGGKSSIIVISERTQ